jgi:hypothetical protein
VRADISVERKDGKINFVLEVLQAGTIPKLSVRLPGAKGPVWKKQNKVGKVTFTSAS